MAGMRDFRAVLFVVVALGWSCQVTNPGEPPDEAKLYFPVAVALSQEQEGNPARHLFVVNSNFDLRFNAGSIQAYDLNELDQAIGKCRSDEACAIPTSRCHEDEVLIGSFASGIALSRGGDRLFVPVRGDKNLVYVNLSEDSKGRAVLKCWEGGGDDRRCSGGFVVGDTDLYEFPRDPVGLIAGRVADFYPERQEAVEDAESEPERAGADDYVLVAHADGEVSLFTEVAGADPEEGERPKAAFGLTHVLEGVSPGLTGIAFDPATRLAYLSSVSYGISYKSLARVGLDEGRSVDMLRVYNAGWLQLQGISPERDTRAVDFGEGLEGRALLLSRWPPSVMMVDVRKEALVRYDALVSQVVEVGPGASRLTVGRIGHDSRVFAFVSCFSAHEIFVVDIELGLPVAVIRGFSGPFELVVDRWRERLYVADFRSSVVRVVDLAPIVCRADDNELNGADPVCPDPEKRSARIVATLGEPSPPEELI